MQIPQFYQTTLISKHADVGLHLVTLPARSIPEFGDPAFEFHIDTFKRIAFERLDIYEHDDSNLDDLKNKLLDLILESYETGSREEERRFEDEGGVATLPQQDSTLDVQVEASTLVDAFFSTPVIPFERSPLDAESLTKILSATGGTGVGAYLGFVVAGGTPLAIVLVPAGMILCGAAAGIGDGLYTRLKRWIAGQDAAPPS